MKQLSNNLWEFHPQIYPQYLWIAVKPDKEEYSDFIRTYDGKELEVDQESAHATVYHVHFKDNPDTGSLIVFKDKDRLDFKIVTHEAVHVVSNIFEICGLKHEPNNDESFAYLAGWVAECCEKIKKEYDNRD